MSIFDKIFGKHQSSKSSSTTTRDPWAAAVPYLKDALGTGQGIFDEYSQLSPEEQAASGDYASVLRTRQQSPVYGQAQDAASSILGGAYNPQLQRSGAVAPALTDYAMGTANPAKARATQGALDPTASYQKLLSGEVDNPQLAAMAEAATRQGQRNYGDAVQDSEESLTRSVLPAVRSGAVASGGYGGSRQGIAEGLAIGDHQKTLDRAARDLGIAGTDATANLYGGAYEAAQGRMAGAASELDARAQQAKQFDAANALEARKFNAGQDQRAQEFNVNNTNTQNAQELARAGLAPTILGQGLDLARGAASQENDDYDQLLSVLGLPRSTAQDAYANMVSPLTGIAGLGGTSTSKGKTSSYQRDSLFDIGKQIAAMFAGG